MTTKFKRLQIKVLGCHGVATSRANLMIETSKDNYTRFLIKYLGFHGKAHKKAIEHYLSR